MPATESMTMTKREIISAEFAAFFLNMCQTAYSVRSHVLRSMSVLCILVTTFDAESEFVNCDAKAPRFPERTKWIFTLLVYRTFCRCDASSLLNIRAKKVRTSTLLSYVCQGQIRAEKQMKFFFVNFFTFSFSVEIGVNVDCCQWPRRWMPLNVFAARWNVKSRRRQINASQFVSVRHSRFPFEIL